MRRISLPAEPMPVPAHVQNEASFDETCNFPGFEQLLQLSHTIRNVPMPNPADWHRFGVRRDSTAATMMKTEVAEVPRSIATLLAPLFRLDRRVSSTTARPSPLSWIETLRLFLRFLRVGHMNSNTSFHVFAFATFLTLLFHRVFPFSTQKTSHPSIKAF